MQDVMNIAAVGAVGSSRHSGAASAVSFAASQSIRARSADVRASEKGSQPTLVIRAESRDDQSLKLVTVRESVKRSMLTDRQSAISGSLQTIVQSQRFLAQLKDRTGYGSAFAAG